MATARIAISAHNDDGAEMITEILEFEVPEDKAKRRRLLMRHIGKIVDDSTFGAGPTSFTVIFNDIP